MNGETVIRDVLAGLIVVGLATPPVVGQSTPADAIPLPVPADQSLASRPSRRGGLVFRRAAARR